MSVQSVPVPKLKIAVVFGVSWGDSHYRTLAKREAQIGSTSAMLAALMRVVSLSAWERILSVNLVYPSPIALAQLRIVGRNPAWGRIGENCWILAYGDLDTIIGEDKRRVGRCELCGRHCDDVCDLSRAKVLRLERGFLSWEWSRQGRDFEIQMGNLISCGLSKKRATLTQLGCPAGGGWHKVS